jgi:hypothetical protein
MTPCLCVPTCPTLVKKQASRNKTNECSQQTRPCTCHLSLPPIGKQSGDWPAKSSEEQGFTRQTRRLQNKPKNSPIGQEMTEIWSKQYLDHISVISCPIGLFLGSFWSLRVCRVNPCSSLAKSHVGKDGKYPKSYTQCGKEKVTLQFLQLMLGFPKNIEGTYC